MKKRDYIIIWPQYISANKKRSEGRKISLKEAVEKVKPFEIVLAAEKLGYKAEFLPEKCYPKSWWEKGCIKVLPKKEKKITLLKKISYKIKEIRKKGKSI